MAAVLVFGGLNALRVLGASLASAMLSEILAGRLFQKKAHLEDGNTVLIGILLGLILPVNLASWKIILAGFVSVFLAKEIFGGTGAYLFNPALVGFGFLMLCFPQFSYQNLLIVTNPWAFKIFAGTLLLGGLTLMGQKLIAWEIPVFYLLPFWGLDFLLHGQNQITILLNVSLLAAFYFLADSAALPMSRTGKRLFAVFSGLLGALLGLVQPGAQAICFSLLVLNAATPWLDGCFKPKIAANL